MYFEERKRKSGKSTSYAVDRYVDPLTGKAKREVVKFSTNTARARKQAERDLAAKIEEQIAVKQGAFNGAAMVTFGELKAKWLETWQTTVKPPTVTREKMVLKRIAELMADDVLLEVITPLLIQNLLNDYKKKYHFDPLDDAAYQVLAQQNLRLWRSAQRDSVLTNACDQTLREFKREAREASAPRSQVS